MKNNFIFLAFFLLLFIKCFSQENIQKTKNVINNYDYDYIPIEYLKDTTIVGLTHSFDISKKNNKRKEFIFFWNSFCIDGRYYIKVTPKQIFLYSGHENPNPNNIYWVINLSDNILNILFKNFEMINELSCENRYCYDEKYNENEYKNQDCENLRLKQAERIIDKINKLILDPKSKIIFSQRIEPTRSLYYGYSEEQILNSIPIIIEDKK